VNKPKWQHVSALCEQATKKLKINFKNKECKYTSQKVSTFRMSANNDDTHLFPHGLTAPSGPASPHFQGFMI